MLGRLNHVAIAVADAEKAAKIYGTAFGAEISAAVPLPEHGVITVFATLPNTKIEFIQPLGDASPIAKFIDRNPDGGIHHLRHQVPDTSTPREPPAAGAFDALDSNRARVFAGSEAILAACQRGHEAATVGQNDMFGGAADAPTIMLPQVEPWLPAERLRREYDAIGFFLSGHPLDDYATVLKRLRVQSWAGLPLAV